MDKKISVLSENEDEYELFWRGFCFEAYSWVNEHLEKAKWITGKKGNCLRIQKICCSDFISILLAQGYTYENASFVRVFQKNKENSFIPRNYQSADAIKMFKKKKMINASEMGTGKTCTAIMAAKYVCGKVLIICPASVKYCWAAELEKICPDETYAVFEKGTNCNNVRWLIMTYDQFRSIPLDFGYNEKCLILDEAHYIKSVDEYGNPGSKRAARCLTEARKTEYVYLLSGTIMPSYTVNLYNLASAVNAYDITFYDDFTHFAYRYCDPRKITVNGRKITIFNGSKNLRELNEKLSHYMIRRKRAEVLPGINKLRQYIPIKIGISGKFNSQAINSLGEIMRARLEIAKAKAKYTLDFVNDLIEQGKKVVIVSCFIEPIDYFQSKLCKCVCLTGNMSPEQRIKAVQEFQLGDAKVMVLSLTAGGVGITLTASDTMVFNDFDYVPANMLQAEDRICRIGQNNSECSIYYMVAKNALVDELTAQIVERKMNSINVVVDNGDIRNELLFNLSKGRS